MKRYMGWAAVGLVLLLWAGHGRSGLLWLLLVAVLALLVVTARWGRTTQVSGRRAMADKGGWGGRARVEAAKHEARHRQVALAVGMDAPARLTGFAGGDTKLTGRVQVEEYFAVLWAGGMGDRGRCGSDDAEIRALRSQVPAAEWGAVQRRGKAIARRLVSQRASAIERDTAELLRRGRVG